MAMQFIKDIYDQTNIYKMIYSADYGKYKNICYLNCMLKTLFFHFNDK